MNVPTRPNVVAPAGPRLQVATPVKLSGPKVVRVPFDAQGRAMPSYEDFMTGFTVSDYEVWGRPVGVAVGKDGALYVSEDANRTIWCVAPKSQMP